MKGPHGLSMLLGEKNTLARFLYGGQNNLNQLNTMFSNKIKYIGCDDATLELFENQYTLSEGMCYNSYLLLGEKIAVMDSVDARKTEEWLYQIQQQLAELSNASSTPHYLIIQHMEPDHSGSIGAFLEAYPDAIVVGSKTALQFMEQFGYQPVHRLVVKSDDVLDLGGLTLHFVSAPMVHWPEVMMSYCPEEKTMFSADAFGSFGVYNAHPDNWIDEARRYYVNICGKYGRAVAAALTRFSSFDIQTIAPLHGCVLDSEKMTEAWRMYSLWSAYKVETDGVLVAYASIHGNTAAVAHCASELLRSKGVIISKIDLCRVDVSEAVSQAFKYSRMLLCASSYDAGLFPPMYVFLYKLGVKGYQSRRVALMENGTWAPCAGRVMLSMLESMKNIEIVAPLLTIRSAWKEEYQKDLDALIEGLLA